MQLGRQTVDLSVTTEQAIALSAGGSDFVITHVTYANPSGPLGSAAGTVFYDTAKTNPVVAGSSFPLAHVTAGNQLTLDHEGGTTAGKYSPPQVYWASSAVTAGATVDVIVFGEAIS